jgi:hypothetical protein
MEQITIYVSEVIRYLPQKSQSEIKKELTTNILDMVDELTAGGISEKDAVASVLSKMGNPRLLADQYLDKKAYLIGPRYYPTYLMIAKIVSGAVALGITIALSVQYMFDNGVLREIVPIFNIQNASSWLPLLSIAIALNAISDGVAMAIRNQTKNTMWVRLALNLISLILFAYVLINGNIFNAQLATQIAPNSSELANLWILVQRNVVVIVIIANLISMAIQAFQIIRFNKE